MRFAWRKGIITLGILCPVLAAAEEWQREAIKAFPDLAKEESPLHKEFAKLYKEARDHDGTVLKDPKWPLILAQQAFDKISPPFDSETGRFRDKRGKYYQAQNVVTFGGGGFVYQFTVNGLPENRTLSENLFSPTVIEWLAKVKLAEDKARRIEEGLDKLRRLYIIEIDSFERGGVLATVRPAEEVTGLSGEKKVVAKLFSDSQTAFVECEPKKDVLSGDRTYAWLYPAGVYQVGGSRYRRFTLNRKSALQALKEGRISIPE